MVYNVNVKSELFKVSRTVNDLNDGMTEGRLLLQFTVDKCNC